jgi:sialate O-acetylesterase
MNKSSFRGVRLLLPLLLSVLAWSQLHADVKMPAIFGDHMVLEQDIKIPVWGTAAPGEEVSVSFSGKSAKATADAKGKWRVDLDPVATSSTASTLTVTGKNTLTFQNVLVGDVWVCSGQSNMEFDLAGNLPPYTGFGGASSAATAVPAANDPLLRLFVVSKKVSIDPVDDVVGYWRLCTPDSAAVFSAVGYFFGQELRKSLNKPIGLIGTYWGGMPAQAFTSLSGLQKDPPFTNYVTMAQGIKDNYDKNKADFPANVEEFKTKMKEWNDTTGKDFAPIMKQWQEDSAKAVAAGQPVKPKPQPAVPMPKQPTGPDGAPNTPTVLYNGMIAPIIPYGIKGAIWYQGEANAGNPREYATLFPRMISDWREKWGEGDFPFLFVQLAAFMAPQKLPSEGGWAGLREAQLKTLSLPNTGMAVAIDVGMANDIHPKDKFDVGQRLALAAKHVAYGQTVVYSGPIYDSMKVEGNKIRLSFQNVGSGLKMDVPPFTPPGMTIPPPTELTGFAIAGEDKNFVWAKAVIDGNDVVVSSDAVAAPVAVRYGWASNPPCDLYNKEGLPASPFRTDDWDMGGPMAKPPTPPVAKP